MVHVGGDFPAVREDRTGERGYPGGGSKRWQQSRGLGTGGYLFVDNHPLVANLF